jgi:group I intron endonuclease
MKSGIYKITSPTGRIYIGQSKDIEARWSSYRRGNFKNQPLLKASFLKHGVQAHRFEVVELCPPEALGGRELFHGQRFGAIGRNGMNLKLGGEIQITSEATRFKMAESAKSVWKSNREVFMEAYLERSKNPVYLQAMKAAASNREDDFKNIQSKAVVQFDIKGEQLKTFRSLREAARETGISAGNISAVCNGDYLTSGGFVFRFEGEPLGKFRIESERRFDAVKISMFTKSGELLRRFESIGEASRETGISKGNISKALAGKLKSTGGYLWKF